MHLLITRPIHQAAATAANLRQVGHRVWVEPLLQITPLQFQLDPPSTYAAVAITSANGLPPLRAHEDWPQLSGLPFFCSGRHTAEMARGAGVKKAISADGGVIELGTALVDAGLAVPAKVLYPAGRDRAGDLAAALAGTGLTVVCVPVYAAEASENLTNDLADALRHNRIDGALVYSSRSCKILLECSSRAEVIDDLKRLRIIAISKQAAAPALAAGLAHVTISDQANETAMLRCLQTLSNEVHRR